jgi:hypothetical protein
VIHTKGVWTSNSTQPKTETQQYKPYACVRPWSACGFVLFSNGAMTQSITQVRGAWSKASHYTSHTEPTRDHASSSRRGFRRWSARNHGLWGGGCRPRGRCAMVRASAGRGHGGGPSPRSTRGAARRRAEKSLSTFPSPGTSLSSLPCSTNAFRCPLLCGSRPRERAIAFFFRVAAVAVRAVRAALTAAITTLREERRGTCGKRARKQSHTAQFCATGSLWQVSSTPHSKMLRGLTAPMCTVRKHSVQRGITMCQSVSVSAKTQKKQYRSQTFA